MKKSDIARFAGASAIAVASILAAQPALAEDGDIIVTATKREAALSVTPLSASAVSGEDLADANAQSLGDYIARLPGVVFNDYQPGVSEVVIRGISATTYHEQGQTTVGYYLNEIPLVEPGFPIGIPDVDTFDLDRVEVLRGPQGTLFGSSTLGGLVNYVVNTADTSKVDAAASGLLGITKNSDGELNYAAKAMVNVPLIKDVLAVRVLGYQRFDAGYLDNPGTGVDGSNDFRTRGLRGSVAFTPGADTKLVYLGVYQDTYLEDQTYLDTDNPYIRNTARAEPQKTSFQLHSLRLEQGIGEIADLPPDSSPIQIGTEGVLDGRGFSVVGRIVYEYEDGGWNEWHLVYADGTSGWLSDAQLEYAVTSLVQPPRPLPRADKVKLGANYAWEDRPLEVATLTRARYKGVEGELLVEGLALPLADLAEEVLLEADLGGVDPLARR